MNDLRRVGWYPLVDGSGVVAEVPLDFQGLPVFAPQLVVAVQDGAVRRAVGHRVWHPQMVDLETTDDCKKQRDVCEANIHRVSLAKVGPE